MATLTFKRVALAATLLTASAFAMAQAPGAMDPASQPPAASKPHHAKHKKHSTAKHKAHAGKHKKAHHAKKASQPQ